MTNTATCEKGIDQAQSCKCTRGAFSARFDIWETDEELVLQGDMPGVAADDLEITYENRELTILGKVVPRYRRDHLLLEEYPVDNFSRSFTIGESIDAEKISAELCNGVVTVHLPKTEETKPRRIKVDAKS